MTIPQLTPDVAGWRLTHDDRGRIELTLVYTLTPQEAVEWHQRVAGQPEAPVATLDQTAAQAAPTAPPMPAGPVPDVGGAWNGVEVVRRSDKDGVTVIVLADQGMVKLETATGKILARKTPGYQVAEAKAMGPGDLTIAPTSRQTGERAPREDAPVQVPPDHILTQAILDAATMMDLVKAARDAGVTVARLVDWAREVKATVPVLRPIADDKLQARIERALLLVQGAG